MPARSAKDCRDSDGDCGRMPPWSSFSGSGDEVRGSSDPRLLYQDVLIALAPDRRINNGQPSLHAACLAEADPQPGESVLHVGAGTGYYTAILAELVGPSGRVIAHEIEASLSETCTRFGHCNAPRHLTRAPG